ncbi:MAG: DUF992 domain-containing protein [Rhodospirillales bacterium]|nr:DUF992 domain-containing protein [Alphaproteobacteria bacterium]MBL6947613.1 DUF992 domain-containing protein [Rhodospirillales bacterium]
MKKTITALFLGLVLIGAGAPAGAGHAGVKLGVLKCTQIPGSGTNLLIHSTVQVKCVFTSITGERQAIYKGETGIGLGIDLNWNKSETLVFTVLGATGNVGGSHPLAGKYIGGRASASVGVGAGAQALIGAGKNHLTLQPLALESARGFGVAAGLGYLYLEPSR